MHGHCDILRRSPGERRIWNVFVWRSEWGVETLEEIVQVEEVCSIQAERRG